MKWKERGYKQRTEFIIGSVVGRVKNFQDKQLSKKCIDKKHCKVAQVKEKRVAISWEPVIKSQRGRYYRSVALVAWIGAEGGGIGKKFRDVFYILDERVVLDGMWIVKMKWIMKMI